MWSFPKIINMVVSIIWLLLINLNSSRAQGSPGYLDFNCSNSTAYNPNSTFQTNLNLLLSSLSLNSTKNNWFFNSTIGRDSPNVAYGLYLCRGDLTSDICQLCVSEASAEIVKRCPNKKEAVIWYEACMVRYANRSFFSIVDQTLVTYFTNAQNIMEQTRFQQVLNSTLDDLVTRASNGNYVNSDQPLVKGFATEIAKFTSAQTLYGLAQCTPDLSRFDCSHCLRMAMDFLPQCCNGKRGGRVLMANCNFRYELYPFYNIRDSPPSASPAPSSLTKLRGKKVRISSQKVVAIVAVICVSLVLCGIGYCVLVRKKAKRKYEVSQEEESGEDYMITFNFETEIATAETLRVNLGTVKTATNNFSADNKIGEGGFGEVFKVQSWKDLVVQIQGVLANGQEIAVKRLSKSSNQGAEEFKNEVILVAKLQHRNLVRLLRFCLEGEEKILIYEYIPNKSLDYILFDAEKQVQLDWARRYKIIGGIAKGMLYLHEESRLRVIHRDLKASNVLLDADMNPKVSDFGMARIFGVDQTRGKTSRIVGTYGYMSPEYAMHGHFSVRSDVFSFGVLILEIISGKRNNSFYLSNHAEDLLCYAWRLWRDGTPLELMDPTLSDSYSRNEVIRCIHIGLLCVQEHVDARPSMESVVLMLNSYSVTLSMPQQPPFFVHSRRGPKTIERSKSDYFTNGAKSWSVDYASITGVYPR